MLSIEPQNCSQQQIPFPQINRSEFISQKQMNKPANIESQNVYRQKIPFPQINRDALVSPKD